MKTISHSIPHSLCLLLLTLLTALALPGQAVAQNEVGTTDDGTLAYTLYDDGTATVTGYYNNNEPSGDLVIPAEITNNGQSYRVTSIGGGAFNGCSSLTSVTLPEGLTSIENLAFNGCSGLTSVTLPQGLTSIGNWAFEDCSGLTSVTLPQGLTSIGEEAFSHCSGLKSVTFPEGLTSIGNKAFYYCTGLTSVTVPEGLTSIGSNAFYGCTSLTSVTLPQGLTSIGDGAFNQCSGLTNVTLPQGLTSIGDYAFDGCSGLTSLTLPQGLTSIGESAFRGCSGLTSATLPQGLTSIGDGAFNGCSRLSGDFTFPEGLTSIEDWAFYGCSGLTSVTFPEGLTSIGYSAFSSCSGLTSVTLPKGLTSIGEDAFYECYGLTSVTLPEGLTSIGYHAFYYCSSLTSVYCLSEDPSWYDSYAFDYSSSTTYYVPASAVAAYQSKFSSVTSIPTASLPISSAQLGTCYTSQESFLIPEGLVGGIVTAAEAKDGGKLSVDWRYKAGTYVPAGVPLVLKGEAGTYERYCLPANALTADMSGLDQNLLRGTNEDATTTAADSVSDAVFYKFNSNEAGTEAGFYWVDNNGSAFTNPAGTCYLALPRAQYGQVKHFLLDDSDETAVGEVTIDAPAAQGIYTLDGRKVNATTTKGLPAGLYIVDGQKVMVK